MNQLILNEHLRRTAYWIAGQALAHMTYTDTNIEWMQIDVEPYYDDYTDDMIPDLVSGILSSSHLYHGLEIDNETGVFQLASSFNEDTMSDEERSELRTQIEGDIVDLLAGPIAEAAYLHGITNRSEVLSTAADLLFQDAQAGGATQVLAAYAQHLNALGIKASIIDLTSTAYEVVVRNWREISAVSDALLAQEYHTLQAVDVHAVIDRMAA